MTSLLAAPDVRERLAVRIPDEPAPFADWLLGLPRLSIAGYRVDPHRCVFVAYLRAKGALAPVVGSFTYVPDMYCGVSSPMPDRARKVRREFDDGEIGSPVSVNAVLGIVERLGCDEATL